jgi:hypothetical protein
MAANSSKSRTAKILFQTIVVTFKTFVTLIFPHNSAMITINKTIIDKAAAMYPACSKSTTSRTPTTISTAYTI